MGKHVARVERDLINHVDITRNTGGRPSGMIYARVYACSMQMHRGDAEVAHGGVARSQGSRISTAEVSDATIRHRVIPTTLVIPESVKSPRDESSLARQLSRIRCSTWRTITQLLSSRRLLASEQKRVRVSLSESVPQGFSGRNFLNL